MTGRRHVDDFNADHRFGTRANDIHDTLLFCLLWSTRCSNDRALLLLENRSDHCRGRYSCNNWGVCVSAAVCLLCHTPCFGNDVTAARHCCMYDTLHHMFVALLLLYLVRVLSYEVCIYCNPYEHTRTSYTSCFVYCTISYEYYGWHECSSTSKQKGCRFCSRGPASYSRVLVDLSTSARQHALLSHSYTSNAIVHTSNIISSYEVYTSICTRTQMSVPRSYSCVQE